MIENLKNEKWLPVDGYDGIYEVSTMGRIKTLQRTFYDKKGNERIVKEKIRKPYTTWDGYLRISFYGHGYQEKTTVHRAVAKAFIPNPNNLPIVNHKDGNRKNNSLDNLEWVSESENTLHSFRVLKRIHPRSKSVINNVSGKIFKSIKDAALFEGINPSYLRSMLNGGRKNTSNYSIYK